MADDLKMKCRSLVRWPDGSVETMETSPRSTVTVRTLLGLAEVRGLRDLDQATVNARRKLNMAAKLMERMAARDRATSFNKRPRGRFK